MTVAWPKSPDELVDLQNELAAATPDPWRPSTGDPPAIAACVILFPRGQAGTGATGDPAWAAAAVMRRRQVVASSVVAGAAAGPYIPGLLALREGPCLEAAVRALDVAPDLLLVDATGRDHPRRAGLALHLGAVIDIPTVGVTHRPLIARGEWPAPERGAWTPLMLDGERVGAWLRTRADARPLAIHPGWRTTLEVAIDIVLTVARGHRTPEPFRHARRLARAARSAHDE